MSNSNNSWKNRVIINKIKVSERVKGVIVTALIRATLLHLLPLTSTL